MQMETCTQASELTIKLKVEGNTYIQMEHIMRASDLETNNMARELKSGRITLSIKGSTSKEGNMGKGGLSGRMEVVIKGILWIII